MSDPDIERIVEQAKRELQRQHDDGEICDFSPRDIARRAAELAVAKERERCAKVCENLALTNASVRPQFAAAIRAGKEVGSE